MEARRRAQLTGTNLSRDLARSFEASLKRAFAKRSLRLSASKFAKRLSPFGPNSSDGHGGAAPPLPIPNRIVKRPRADDSGVLPCESRSPSDSHPKRPPPGAFLFHPSAVPLTGSAPAARTLSDASKNNRWPCFRPFLREFQTCGQQSMQTKGNACGGVFQAHPGHSESALRRRRLGKR